jgi:hypothetical protein
MRTDPEVFDFRFGPEDVERIENLGTAPENAFFFKR